MSTTSLRGHYHSSDGRAFVEPHRDGGWTITLTGYDHPDAYVDRDWRYDRRFETRMAAREAMDGLLVAIDRPPLAPGWRRPWWAMHDDHISIIHELSVGAWLARPRSHAACAAWSSSPLALQRFPTRRTLLDVRERWIVPEPDETSLTPEEIDLLGIVESRIQKWGAAGFGQINHTFGIEYDILATRVERLVEGGLVTLAVGRERFDESLGDVLATTSATHRPRLLGAFSIDPTDLGREIAHRHVR